MALLGASFLKLRKRTASWVVLGLLLAVVALVFIGLAASAGQTERMGARLQVQILLGFPNAYAVIVSIILSFGGLLALTYGAAVGGAEWAWGTIRAAVGRGESRVRYTASLIVALFGALGVAVVLAFGLGAVTAVMAADMAGMASGRAGDPEVLAGLPDLLARTWLGIAEQAAIGFAVAMLFRSQLAGVAAGLGLYFGEFFLILVPIAHDILPYLPFSVAQAVVATAEGFGPGSSPITQLDTSVAVPLAFLYLAGAVLLACFAAWRAQITE